MHKKPIWRSAVSVALAAVVLLASIMITPLHPTAYAVSQWEIDALKQQKETIAANKQAQKEALEALEAEQAGYLEQKAVMDKQEEMAVQEINLTKEQLEMYNQMIAEKEQEAQAAQEAADAQLELYKEHLRSMEEQGTFNFYLSLLFSAESFSDLLTRIDMITEIMEYDKRVEQEYKDARDFALEVKAEYEDYAAELTEKADELQSEIDALQEELAKIHEKISAMQSDIDFYQEAYNQYAADEDKLLAEIDRMTEELKKQNTPVSSTGNYIWPCPSCYTISSNYGYRIHPIYGTKRLHAGTDIAAQYGAEVVAADGGNVTVATYSSSYGNYVMIYHADGSSTLYAHMSSLAVSAGETVNQGDVIGYVGSTGNSTGPHLHFEVRVNGSTVDPMNYF